jgi:hypothetical protein
LLLNREQKIMVGRRLRFRDFKERGIVSNYTTLRNRIKFDGFPPGEMTGRNERSWDEGAVEAWLTSRPQGLKPVPAKDRERPVGAGRKRKAATPIAEAAE